MESIEKGYVMVNPHYASLDGFSYHFETSLQEPSIAKLSLCPPKKNDHLAVAVQAKELATSSAGGAESSQLRPSASLESSFKSSILNDVQGLTVLHPSVEIQLLHQYVCALVELAAEKVKISFL